ncbi:serine hydrolase domain-containing protein [Staphylococcus debuckii]|uniref:Serine hydrolase domain-containing protein n=1 Tax=Staphylococcus debuckii TaxID=2044912 RepID=A0ABU9EZR4_9STAP
MKNRSHPPFYIILLFVLSSLLFLGIALILILQSTYAASRQSSRQTLNHSANHQIHELMKQQDIPGMSVLMIQHGKVILNQGYGYQNLSKHQHATKNTQYEIASDTKAFTGLAILQLAKEHKVDLKAPVRKYVPWLHLYHKGRQTDVTIEQLIAQTSGISDSMSSDDEETLPKSKDNLKDRVKSINQATLKEAPGQQFNYANMNYNVLGYVVEQVSHQSYEAYIHQHILTPLHMQQTYFKTEKPTAVQKRSLSKGYIKEHGNIEADRPAYFKGDTPAAYMISSTTDLIPWVKYQLKPGASSRSIIAQSHQKLADTPYDKNAVGYGSGWFLNPESNQVLHPGTLPNYASFILLNTKDQNAVVILSNLNSSGIPNLAKTLDHQLAYFNEHQMINHYVAQHATLIGIVLWLLSLISTGCLIGIGLLVYHFRQHRRTWRYRSLIANSAIILISILILVSVGIALEQTPGRIIHALNWDIALIAFSPPFILVILLSFCTIVLLTVYLSLLLLWKKKQDSDSHY